MPNWIIAALAGCLGYVLTYGAAPHVRRWWRRRRMRRAIELGHTHRPDPVRLQQLEHEAAHASAAEQSERAATFCQRYAADLIASGVKPTDAYLEAMAIYTNEVV